ncbi:VWA domain-containing protein [Aureimonas sp. SA4125]|uniref:VWA domain-containing protein n=1 Tax=Aureimonas sp. SA4125 TaxID=2826993 RepID=UPI001CC5903E|nr:VWA domain-containing protein [Aureimonas sp. SA4125]BDA85634.1 VWA domain-containing protein [Aureimonas sp. SA4125]
MVAPSAFDFAWPLAFLLLPLPFLAMRFLSPSGEAGGALRVPETLVADFADGQAVLSSQKRRLVLSWLLWILLVLAIAGPRTVTAAPAAPASGRDIVLSLDVSGSMERPDFEVAGEKRRRMDVLKTLARTFVLGRAGDRIGLVIFGERAYVAAPLSFDVAAVAKIVDSLDVGLAGRSTAIGEGLGLALKKLSDSDARSKIVILLSDGAQNAGTVQPGSAAELARTLGIRVDTIAMGPIDLGQGQRGDEGVDVATLSGIAAEAGGTAYRVRTTEQLTEVMASIDALETSPSDAPATIVHASLWPYPGALALGISGLMMLGRRGRR